MSYMFEYQNTTYIYIYIHCLVQHSSGVRISASVFTVTSAILAAARNHPLPVVAPICEIKKWGAISTQATRRFQSVVVDEFYCTMVDDGYHSSACLLLAHFIIIISLIVIFIVINQYCGLT